MLCWHNMGKGMKIRAMAAELGVDTKTIRRWVRSGCPHARAGPGRTAALVFDPPKVVAWMERVDRDGTGGSHHSPIVEDSSPDLPAKATPAQELNALAKRVAIEVKKLEVKKRKRIERMADGALLDAGLVNRGRIERIAAVKSGLQALAGKLPARLVDRSEPEIRRILEVEIDDVCQTFADGFREMP